MPCEGDRAIGAAQDAIEAYLDEVDVEDIDTGVVAENVVAHLNDQLTQ